MSGAIGSGLRWCGLALAAGAKRASTAAAVAVVLVAIVAPAGHAGAEQILQLPRAAGGMLPWLLSADLPDPAAPVEAMAILFNGGEGAVGLGSRGIPRPGANFLVRSRALFVARGIPVAIIDVPDSMRGMPDSYRMSRDHAADVDALAGDLQARFAGARLYLVGTSRGTVSAAYAGSQVSTPLAGVVLTSSVFLASRNDAGLAGFDLGRIRAPLLLVHHAEDACRVTPYDAAQRLADRYPLVTVHGGLAPTSGPCDPFAAHGFFGREAGTVNAIADWMLGRPYARSID